MGCPESKVNDSIDECESLDDVAELGQVQKLNHIVKDRPKRARSHAPKRPMTRQTKILDDNAEQDEGLDRFFSKTSLTEVAPNANKDKVQDKVDTSSSGTGSGRSTPESKKKTGWLKGLGGKDKEKKLSSGLFSRSKGSKSSEDKIKRISEVDENKSNLEVSNGPVDTVTKDVIPEPETQDEKPVPPTTTPPTTTEVTPPETSANQTKTETTKSSAQTDTQASSGTSSLSSSINETSASPSSGTPDSEQKPETPEENDVTVEKSEKKEEEKSEEPAKVRRHPAGIPKIGLGGNVLAEMRAKQEKRMTIQESKPKTEKMPSVTKLNSHKEEKSEGTSSELRDSKKSNDTQSSQSSISSVEEPKNERSTKSSSPVNGDEKSSPELNNNVKVKPSAGRQALLPVAQKRVNKANSDSSKTEKRNTAGLDLSLKIKTGQKPPPPVKPRPPQVAPKPTKKTDVEEVSSEDNMDSTEQEDNGHASPVPEKNKGNESVSMTDSNIAPMREKKESGGPQSVRDRIKSMELSKPAEPTKDESKKAVSLPRGITPGDMHKANRPASVATTTLAELKSQLKTPLATSTPALNTVEDDKTIYENLVADLDDEIYENLKISKDEDDLENGPKNKEKTKDDNQSEVDKVQPVAADQIIMV